MLQMNNQKINKVQKGIRLNLCFTESNNRFQNLSDLVKYFYEAKFSLILNHCNLEYLLIKVEYS